MACRHGKATHSKRGEARRGKASQARRGRAWHGRARRGRHRRRGWSGRWVCGVARQGRHWFEVREEEELYASDCICCFSGRLGVRRQRGHVTINFTTLPASTAGGYYVGNNGRDGERHSTKSGLRRFRTTTYVPSGPFQYNVATLANLSTAKFTGLANYEAAAGAVVGFRDQRRE